ncbi:TDP-N-acetylfucosamine:lipid II N-acetylfucosaminyltransferase [Campylobacter sp. RM9344]|uniref:TDP-N-acetylfucosamine:lipid II N-acetylfucosaminyltransferase n=1 Tax=Campylobacter californiensis TaxID=1032243 RepID=A0AAW3ZS90_9BACT|nr:MULTISPECIES: TDP-N-acetylfucosamine:lipid II N-acetylfucosaminyltransferase [unclassified Campylobacter]MBE2983887.1 TDP-N-acetylfucosamine:lipid II N-acetylfucosaminyltransferase [Campylobacter sp. RM6883]MBE2986049.1 TDP-N-acetylfucosamine:lipid II N-acetylfucosaminyltransferase [Campylobacter sp. RM12919]MBE2987462.1 TDP-N-acetylfucosamine:lipid II N-acetylfucosaminyltransferase [Campylobacter sp. RM12920]MBE2994425.1 TDP-N-acetylfucosamine:lipid II N-acetylfucosaminyltransferase [Campyl
MILHLTRKEKFTKPFIDFIKENFNINDHFFLLVGGTNKREFYIDDDFCIKSINNIKDFIKYFIEFNIKMYKSKKIIIHGLSQPYCIFYLFFNPWLIKKCYWIMWGGDFYFPEKQGWIKKQVIRKINNFISVNNKDMAYAINNYQISPKNIFYSQFYPTCIASCEMVESDCVDTQTIKILVGNSSTKENRHKDVFGILERYKNDDIEIIVPLSYGDEKYKNETMVLGRSIFGDKFNPIVDFMDFEEYKKMLQSVDIGIFVQNRQQAGANIKLLAGYGKKLYISKENSFYNLLTDDGIRVYDIENFELKKIEKEISDTNKKISLEKYSLDSLIKSWVEILKA